MEIREGKLASARRRFVGGAAATLVAMLSIVALALTSGALAATAPVSLGTTASYAVLAGTTVTNTGPTLVTGDLGLSPGSSVTGFPPGLVIGTMHVADAAAVQAQSDLVTAYNDAAGRTPATTVAGDDLTGLTLTAGVYSGGALALNGTLTLQGDSSSVFIFQAASTLITASASKVQLDGVSPCNVFWQVGSSATLGTTTSFKGTILALTSIGLNTGATVDGRLLARNGAVTLDSNTVNAQACAPVRTATTTVTHVHDPSHNDITNGSVVVGTAVHDSAIVTGASPSGTITYHFFATGHGSCSGASTDQTVAVGSESSPQTLAIGSYAYSADYSGDNNNLPSTGSCEPFKIVAADTTPPICELKNIVNGPPKQLIIKTQDSGSGLKSIVVNQSTNANTPVPSFTPGTTSEVDVTATKINQSQSSTIDLTVTDLNNNVIHCDPVFATVSIKHRGKASQQTYTHLARAEGKVQLINSKLGVRTIQLRVNGHLLKPVRLAPSQTRLVNVARWMRPGNNNKITVIARGALGSSATVLISD
jgi:hypothetical protein